MTDRIVDKGIDGHVHGRRLGAGVRVNDDVPAAPHRKYVILEITKQHRVVGNLVGCIRALTVDLALRVRESGRAFPNEDREGAGSDFGKRLPFGSHGGAGNVGHSADVRVGGRQRGLKLYYLGPIRGTAKRHRTDAAGKSDAYSPGCPPQERRLAARHPSPRFRRGCGGSERDCS